MTADELKKLAEAANLTIYQRASMTSDEFFEAEQLRSRFRKESPAAILKLLAINAELVEAVKSVITWFDAEDDHSKADFYERLDLCRIAGDNCRAALAKAEGGEL